MTLNLLASQISHWRAGIVSPPRDNELLASLMMAVTEIAEAAECVRYSQWDALPEELADAMIRLLGICGNLNIDIEAVIADKMERNQRR